MKKGNVPVNDQMIQDLIDRREYSQAKNHLVERLKKDPKDPEAHYLMGVMHYFQGEVGPTLSYLKKALEIEPKHTDASICLSVLLNDLGKYDEAKNIFEKANQSVAHKKEGTVTSIDQKFSVKHLELGDLYFRYRRYDESIEEYSKAALLNPHHEEIRIRRAKAYARKGYVSRALQDLQALKHEKPHFLPARIHLGLLYYSQGNMIDAEMEWESVLHMNPENKEASTYLKMAQKARQNDSF